MSDQSSGVVLFDGVCNLCNSSVSFAIERLPASANIRFGAIQSAAGQAIIRTLASDSQALASVVYVEGGKVWLESSAVLKIAGKLRLPWRLASLLQVVPRFVRDPVYRWIARNRYSWFGKQDTCRVPTPELMRWFLDEPQESEVR